MVFSWRDSNRATARPAKTVRWTVFEPAGESLSLRQKMRERIFAFSHFLARYSVRGIRTGRRQGRQKQSGGLFLSPRENPSHSAKQETSFVYQDKGGFSCFSGITRIKSKIRLRSGRSAAAEPVFPFSSPEPWCTNRVSLHILRPNISAKEPALAWNSVDEEGK